MLFAFSYIVFLTYSAKPLIYAWSEEFLIELITVFFITKEMSVNTTGRLCSMISAIHNHPLPKYTLFLFSFGKKISIFVISSGLFSANVCTALLTNDIAHSRPFTKSHLITYQKKVLLYTPFSLLSK